MAISYINNMQTNPVKEISWKELYHAHHRETIVPFKITLAESESPILCEQIVRLLPGKRMVVLGTWNDQLVVIKLFYGGRAAERHFERDLSGVETLLSSGIPTPNLLYHGNAYKNRVHILIFEQIMEAHNLADLWADKTSIEEQVPLMHAVTIELATQHVLGVVQQDLHLNNFLLKGKQIYTLDGGSIENFHEPLPKKPSLDHLGLFFSQLGVGTEKLQYALFHVYARARGWIVKPADIDYLNEATKKWNIHRWNHYQEKIMRNCTAFAKINWASALIMYDRDYGSGAFLKFLADPESVFRHAETTILKTGNTTTVARFVIDGRELVIKRYNIKNTWHWLRRCLRVTRAWESWRLANLLRLFGVPTAKPVAFIEKRFIGLRNQSYFIMEYVNGIDLAQLFAKYKEDDVYFEKMARRFLNVLDNLTKLRISHGDLKATNILIERDRPIMIDLDGMKEHANQLQINRAYKKEIKRFLQNWDNRPSVKALFQRLLQS